MEQLRIVRMKTRVSLVVALRDSYASGPPSDRDLQVRIAGYPRKPIGKPDGTYIFVDLEPGTYRLEIDSVSYFREWRDVTIGPANSIVHIPLLPVPSYPFESRETLVRAMVADAAGQPVRGALATATATSEECVKGRVAEDKVVKGSDAITLASLTGNIRHGDRLLLVGRGAGKAREEIRIADVLEYQKRFRLESGLSSAYPRGSLLFPVFASRTTERGELAIAFPGGKAKTFRVELRIEGDSGQTSAVREIAVEEGNTVNLGTWIV